MVFGSKPRYHVMYCNVLKKLIIFFSICLTNVCCENVPKMYDFLMAFNRAIGAEVDEFYNFSMTLRKT